VTGTFSHEENRDLDHRIEYPDRNCLFYRLTNAERTGRHRIVKQVLADSHTKIDVLHESLRGKVHLYAMLAPHIA